MRGERFFPGNSTCRFAEYVAFRDAESDKTLTATPDLWFDWIRQQQAKGLLLHQASLDDNRMTAGFAGGGGIWAIEAVMADGTSDVWTSEWDIGDPSAPDGRIWRVDYFRHAGGPTRPHDMRNLSGVVADFETALRDIRAFSIRHSGNEGFTSCFDSGLEALNNADRHPGYHQDLYPPHTLSQKARGLLSAASAAWVFGGMGSWNDQGFDGDDQDEYDRVSAALYTIINEAIAVAASSAWPGSGIAD